MKKIVLLLIFISGSFVSAQSFDFQYDHYSLIVKDLDKVGAFYKVCNSRKFTITFNWQR